MTTFGTVQVFIKTTAKGGLHTVILLYLSTGTKCLPEEEELP